MPWRAAAVAVMSLAVVAGADRATAAELVDVPPLRGGAVQIAGAVRTDDGGALVLATVTTGGHARTVLTRLRADGLVQPRFGRRGAATVGSGAAVALAADGVGRRTLVVVRRGARTTIAAFDARGRRVARFGRGGVRALPAGERGVAVAMRGRRAVVAVSGGPCRACRLRLLDVVSGRQVAVWDVAPHAAAGPAAACGPAAISSLAFASAARLLVAGGGTPSAACAPAAVALDGAGALTGAPVGVPDARRVLVGSAAGAAHTCTVASTGRELSVWGGGAKVLARVPERSVLLAATPIPGGGCAVLTRARVHQVTASGRRRTAAIPVALRADTLVRCRAHLLVLGARRTRTHRQGTLVAVPVAGARAAGRGTGCAA